MIPQPPGNFSSSRSGGGLKISNPRKSIKLARAYCHRSGTAIRAIHWPTTSSITMKLGSGWPLSRSTDEEVATPTKNQPKHKSRNQAPLIHQKRRPCQFQDQTSTAMADAQVPGPGLKYPTP